MIDAIEILFGGFYVAYTLHMAGFDGGSSYVPYAEQIVVRKTIWEDIQTELRMMNQNMIDLADGKIKLDSLIETAPVDPKVVTDCDFWIFDCTGCWWCYLSGRSWCFYNCSMKSIGIYGGFCVFSS